MIVIKGLPHFEIRQHCLETAFIDVLADNHPGFHGAAGAGRDRYCCPSARHAARGQASWRRSDRRR
jgi:hypothetical protein